MCTIKKYGVWFLKSQIYTNLQYTKHNLRHMTQEGAELC